VLEAFFTLPLMIPTIVLALAFLLFYTWLGITGGIASLVVAHVIITTPYVVRLVKSSFANYNWNLERAAANLGASPASVFLTVTMPLIMPGILGGTLLSFIVSFDDAVVALFLSGTEAVTLPVRIFNYIDQSPGPIVAAAGSMLVFFSFITMFLVEVTVGTRAAFNVEGTK
jgi:putative spermidine/putrescine transport system permease protein